MKREKCRCQIASEWRRRDHEVIKSAMKGYRKIETDVICLRLWRRRRGFESHLWSLLELILMREHLIIIHTATDDGHPPASYNNLLRGRRQKERKAQTHDY